MNRLALGSGLVALSTLLALAVVPQGCTTADADPRDASADAADGETSTFDGAADHDATASTNHPPAGFTAVAVTSDPRTGSGVAMTLDSNDDPLVAYLEYDSDANDPSLMFVRWDAAAKRFAPPQQVEFGTVGPVDTSGAARPISIAYDASTNSVAIAYLKVAADSPGTPSVWLATASLTTAGKGSPKFAPRQVSEGSASNGAAAMWPSVGMALGKVYVAYAQQNVGCCPPGSPSCAACAGVWMLESAAPAAPVDAGAPATDASTDASDAASSSDSATDASTDASTDATFAPDDVDAGAAPDADAGGPATEDASTGDDASTEAGTVTPPAGEFTRQLLQYGGAIAQPRIDAPMSLAVDSLGKPGLAFFGIPTSGKGAEIFYWHEGMIESGKVVDSNGIQNDAVDLALTFDQAKPRLVAHLVGTASASYDMLLIEAENGIWQTPVPIARSGTRTIGSSSIAVSSKGAIAIAAHTDCASAAPADQASCSDPYVATSTDDATWTVAAEAQTYATSSLNAAYGKKAQQDTLTLAFHNQKADREGAWKRGQGVFQAVVLWRSK